MDAWDGSADAEDLFVGSWLEEPDHSQAETELAFGQRIMEALLYGFGGGECPIDPCANDYEFALKYGLEIDRKPFDFELYKHLIDLYTDDARFLVLMAGAQTGKTARLFVHLLRRMFIKWGGLFGYYFPDLNIARAFSASRFAPFVRSQPSFREYLGADTRGRKGQDNILTRSIGESTLFFLTTAGKSATEGLPLNGVWFDEVRKMLRGDVERAMERYSAQDAPTDVKVSTANYPDSDIHAWFMQGDQRHFHTACRCPDGIVLAQTWPGCILDLRDATPQMVRKVQHAYSHSGVPYLNLREDELDRYPHAAYHCPRCDTVITDPREGWWEPHNPGAWIHSYQMPQLLSPKFSAGRVLYRYETARDIQEFHNSVRGMPFIDETKIIVQPHHLDACVDTRLPWAALQPARWRDKHVSRTAAGVDVQAGYLVVVVKQLAPSGKHRVIHLEVIQDDAHPDGDDKWRKLGKLMYHFDVSVCVVDEAPEHGAALRFARAFYGRVWLHNYDTSESASAPMVQWRDKTKDTKSGGSETKFKFMVRSHRVRALKWSLRKWVHRTNEIPDPRQLIQRLPMQGNKVVFSAHLRKGTKVPHPIAKVLFEHLQQFIFRDVYEDDPNKEEAVRQGKSRQVGEYIGDVDPHFAHADHYSALALARVAG